MVERKEELPLNFIVRKLCAIVTELLGGVAYYRCPSNPGCALWIVLFPNPHFNRFLFFLFYFLFLFCFIFIYFIFIYFIYFILFYLIYFISFLFIFIYFILLFK